MVDELPIGSITINGGGENGTTEDGSPSLTPGDSHLNSESKSQERTCVKSNLSLPLNSNRQDREGILITLDDEAAAGPGPETRRSQEDINPGKVLEAVPKANNLKSVPNNAVTSVSLSQKEEEVSIIIMHI